MFKVTKTPKTPNIIWDGANNRPLCKFVNGVIETNDEALVSKLEALGYTVEGEADAKPLDKMKVDELKAYAAERNIELPEGAKKDEILKAIQEAEAEQ
jgi:hypothetical protein